jgi:hypothetical protein
MPRSSALGNPTIHPDEDEFNRWPFSRALADRIANLGSPEGAAVIGLYGRWGYGKSSVLNFIKYRLHDRHSARAILLDFNPWMFNDRESLLIGFYAKLANELGVALKGTTHKIGKVLTDFGGALSAVPWVGGGLKNIAEAFGKKLADNPIENQREQIKQAMAAGSKMVVVLIDDLDRLERDEIVLMLKLVRLNGDIPNVVYVLCFDDEMIAQAVRSFYGDSSEAGRQFIEKIVQFPFVIPAVSQERMVGYTIKHAQSAAENAGLAIHETDWVVFRDLAAKCLVHRLTTPRQAIRYGSALEFALPILKGEVDALEQMIIEGIRILFPELYAYIRNRDPIFTRSSSDGNRFHSSEDELAEHARQAMKDCSKPEVDAAAGLLYFLFRRPGDIPQSVGDPRYFRRVFGYALEHKEVTDAEMALLLSYAETGDGRLPALVKELADRNLDQLLTLLQHARPSGQVCVELSRALAAGGALFVKSTPVRDDAQAKRLVGFLADLVQRVSRPTSYDRVGVGKRHELATLILRSVEPLTLAPGFVESLSQLNSQIKLNRNVLNLIPPNEIYARPHPESDGSDLVITDDGWPILFAAFVPRVCDFLAREQADILEKGTDANALFDSWERYNRRTLKNWIEPRIKDNPGFVVHLLRYYKTDVSSSSYGSWSYNWVCAVASPSVIREALDKLFGEALVGDDDDFGNLGLARSFLREHEKAIAKAEAEREHDSGQ